MTMTAPASSPDAQILLIHSHTLDPRPFIGRLLQSTVPDKGVIPWTIDNKYYTADVHFRLLELVGDDDVDDVEASVIVYAFEGSPPSPLPEALTSILETCAPDVALAVRVQSASEKALSAREEFEDVFLEAGMDLEDELGDQEKGNEYDLPALESIRQTLQTHMWPTMIRKPLGQGSSTRAQEEDSSADGTAFPVTFESTNSATLPPPAEGSFPALDELELEVAALEARDEFAELDEWLDVDDDGEPIDNNENQTFSDDFANFQSASTTTAAPRAAAPRGQMMDPTALLMHLNSVREQLAGVQNEDERRLRAGREVQRVLAEMGLDIDSEGDYTDDDEEDESDDEDEAEDGDDISGESQRPTTTSKQSRRKGPHKQSSV